MKKILSIAVLLFATASITNAQTDNKVIENPTVKTTPIKTTTTQAKAAGVESFVVNSCKSNIRQRRAAATTNPINPTGNSTITITEKGDYTFFVTPKDGAGKKVAPVRTLLCKNPPCPKANLIVATPNTNGEVEYKNLEPGTYQLTIELDETATNGNSTKDVKQKN